MSLILDINPANNLSKNVKATQESFFQKTRETISVSTIAFIHYFS